MHHPTAKLDADMRFEQKYPTVRPGTYAPDRRLHHASESRICANCGELTEWTDEHLGMALCSEECQHTIETGGGPLSSG